MTEFKAWFQCINGCSGRYPLNEIIYRCPQCNELLEVQHDMDLLKQRSPEEWKELFSQRIGGHEWPYGSSVWGKKEWKRSRKTSIKQHKNLRNFVSPLRSKRRRS